MSQSAKKLCREAAETLTAAGVENAAAEARWLAERFFLLLDRGAYAGF